MEYFDFRPVVMFFISVIVYRHSISARNSFGISIDIFKIVKRVIRV